MCSRPPSPEGTRHVRVTSAGPAPGGGGSRPIARHEQRSRWSARSEARTTIWTAREQWAATVGTKAGYERHHDRARGGRYMDRYMDVQSAHVPMATEQGDHEGYFDIGT